VFARVHHWTLFWARWIQFIPSHLFLRSVWILSRPEYPEWFSGRNSTYVSYFPLPLPVSCPSLFILLHFITLVLFGDRYKLWSSSSCFYLHLPINSSRLCPQAVPHLISRWSTIAVTIVVKCKMRDVKQYKQTINYDICPWIMAFRRSCIKKKKTLTVFLPKLRQAPSCRVYIATDIT